MALRACTVCGAKYETKRPDSSKYCSTRCKNRKLRGAGPPEDLAPVVDLPVKPSSVVAVTRAELEVVGRLNTHLGQAALAAADRIENSRAINGFAALLKEYRDTMREAMADVEHDSDALDEIRSSAALKLISGGP